MKAKFLQVGQLASWEFRDSSGSASNAAAVRFFGTQLLTVRIDLED
jgi:hypothetical protein